MRGTLRISLIAGVALAAGLAVGCASPGRSPATLPSADFTRNEGPANPSIAGVVHDEQGRPIPSVWIEVEGYPNPYRTPPGWRTDAHGRFQIDGVPPGPVQLLVTAGDFWSTGAKKRVATRTGVRDLVIVLDPGPQLLLRIVGYVPGEQPRWARVTWEEPGGERQVRHAPIRDDGWVRFVALPADRELEVWADAEVKRRIVRARGLKPGASEHRIEPGEAKDIAGKVRAPQALLEKRIAEARGPLREHIEVEVYAHDREFRVARTRVESDGTFRVRGLPPGSYLVYAGMFRGLFGEGAKQVEAGTTDLVIDLE